MKTVSGSRVFIALTLLLTMKASGIEPRKASAYDESLANVIASYHPVAAKAGAGGVGFPTGRCVNVSNLPEESQQEQKNILESIKSNGIETIRLPLYFSKNSSRTEPYSVNNSYIQNVREGVSQATEVGLNVVIDFHDASDTISASGTNDRFDAIWQEIANAFRDSPPSVLFELVNEPHGAFGPSNYLKLITSALKGIRKTNPLRIVLVDTFWFANVKGLKYLILPDDRFVIPSIHYYDPMQFTHYRASWRKTNGQTDIFGSAIDLKQFNDSLMAVKEYMDKTGRVPVVGEFGVTNGVPYRSRILYMALVSRGFASIGVQTCAWTWKKGVNQFPLESNGKLLPGMDYALQSPMRPG